MTENLHIGLVSPSLATRLQSLLSQFRLGWPPSHPPEEATLWQHQASSLLTSLRLSILLLPNFPHLFQKTQSLLYKAGNVPWPRWELSCLLAAVWFHSVSMVPQTRNICGKLTKLYRVDLHRVCRNGIIKLLNETCYWKGTNTLTMCIYSLNHRHVDR